MILVIPLIASLVIKIKQDFIFKPTMKEIFLVIYIELLKVFLL
ncbi:hypothetical protein XBI1_2850010 [Xenorhabdus bovienii str. Intermedium]|uniref:Uncharacterized protein n=1 Tax=Xenorhabdus bovienii str. Intermedium TaxID=1379677 RepID=A0A077QL51_XENBV|nr:hypothetical protein XBI1_2850010 [Xenorhabdus bovienii str. Intermedium]